MITFSGSVISVVIQLMLNPLFTKKWVSPYYLSILHGNYATHILSDDERERFNHRVSIALETITPKIALKLIQGHWRESITGSWFAGLKRFPECRETIGKLLVASNTCYAGQSHAFAMACYADDSSVDFLTAYLDEYLRRPDCYYDQNWAMPALMWIDNVKSTDHADAYIADGGLWHRFTDGKISDENQAWAIDHCKSDFWRTMEYCLQHFA